MDDSLKRRKNFQGEKEKENDRQSIKHIYKVTIVTHSQCTSTRGRIGIRRKILLLDRDSQENVPKKSIALF